MVDGASVKNTWIKLLKWHAAKSQLSGTRKQRDDKRPVTDLDAEKPRCWQTRFFRVEGGVLELAGHLVVWGLIRHRNTAESKCSKSDQRDINELYHLTRTR